MLFDANYQLIQSGFAGVTTAADGAFEKLEIPIPVSITEAGYMYIYVSNEDAANVNVHFDDLKITHTKSKIVQMDDYYPFGLAFNSFKREDGTPNKYLFNGIERIDDLDLGWDLAAFRAYDASIGRWLQIDPKTSERESPYVGMGNNPILYSDFLGDTIKVSGSDEFVAQYNQDRAKIGETKEGQAMLDYLDSSEGIVNITEASSVIGDIKDFFSEGAGDEDHVKSSVTEPNGTAEKMNADVAYSQINGVEIDGIETESSSTLAHEFQHASDLLDGTYLNDVKGTSVSVAGRKMEERAVKMGNTIRGKVGNGQVRKTYNGKPIYKERTKLKKGNGRTRDY